MLAGANPKLGRFDPNEPIAPQIDLPPTLLSRFDLIFAVMDKPNKIRDKAIAEHVLKAHMRAGALKNIHNNDETINGILERTSDLKPIYDSDTIRKYISYARNLNPVILPSAEEKIIEHYLKIRKLGEGENATVPITARQLEAYIRISEAAAKLRLSEYVTDRDAEKAIGIVQYYLSMITLDSDGNLDVDRLMTGTDHKQRSKIQTVLGIIRNVGKISENDLFAECANKNLESYDVEECLKKLKQTGLIYEPRVGTLHFYRF